MSDLEERLKKDTDQQLEEHFKVMENDQLLSFFKVTNGFSFTVLMEIAKEGKFRYENKIPPRL